MKTDTDLVCVCVCVFWGGGKVFADSGQKSNVLQLVD